VAHDLRTPLNAISLASQVLELMLSDKQPDAKQTTQMLKTLKRNVQHLDVLARKIIDENVNLDTEVGVKLERRDFDLWPLVEALIHDLHPVAGTSSTRLVNAIPEDLVIFADAYLLRRVFQNLIANAIRYTPQGEVIIDARAVNAGGVECSVRDNGEGIPPERVNLVFEKHEADPEKDGMGLGLAIVKTFIEAHGGAVAVESQFGAGSIFRFTLPPRQA
jgi:signal transduction histidine kinase